MSYSVLLITPPLEFLPFDTRIIDLKHHRLIFAAQIGSFNRSFSIELHRDKTISQPHYERITSTIQVEGIYCGKTSISEREIVEYFNSYTGWNKLYSLFFNDCQTAVIYMLAWLGLSMTSETSDFVVSEYASSNPDMCKELVVHIRSAILQYARELPDRIFMR
eukprot:Phypoly_transcript_18868.p1 GENE.Phypoly_transcript_18868~~Phypoly_transcript_18868.p1  ORF type:complete len:163 (+),score=5.70 Phypoly_transcript_18868:212-700(+)